MAVSRKMLFPLFRQIAAILLRSLAATFFPIQNDFVIEVHWIVKIPGEVNFCGLIHLQSHFRFHLETYNLLFQSEVAFKAKK